jgi:signal transduction histidine kinase
MLIVAKKPDNDEQKQNKNFSIDARAMLTWGRDSIKDHSTAVLELVKNSYDAGASVVEISIFAKGEGGKPMIRIADNGKGMTDYDVSNKWLRIGFSEKRNSKEINGRRKSGEKGVGRISADRLGRRLELRTQAANQQAVGLAVDWGLFEKSGIDLSAIELQDLEQTTFRVPQLATFDKKTERYLPPPSSKTNSKTELGTELTVYELRQKWTQSDVTDLRNELSVLTSPLKGTDDFQIRLVSDINPKCSGVIVSPFYLSAHIEAEFTFDGNSAIEFKFKDRNAQGKLRVSESGTAEWENFVHRPPEPDTEGSEFEKRKQPTHKTLGPVTIKLLFYLREADSIKGTEFSVGDLREFLNLQAGIKVYRDDIRVMPYGDPRKPEGDWLGLGPRKAMDPAGPARPTWKVSPTQIIGQVFLSRDKNPDISDTSGREGLVHGEAFIVLRSLIYGCLLRLESYYHKQFIAKLKDIPATPSPRETIQAFGAELASLKEGLKDAEKNLPRGASQATAKLRSQLSQTLSRVTTLRRSMDALATQATIYRGLATLGIAVATFGHEIEASLELFMFSAQTAAGLLENKTPFLNDAIDELKKSIRAGERVGAWGMYALRRVNSNKRKLVEVEIGSLLQTLLKELKPAFEASSIKIVSKFASVTARSFPMDIESIFINLLTNAYFFCKVGSRKRTISVNLCEKKIGGENGFELTVSDSGPGVSKEISDQIWEPLFSTKVDKDGKPLGTGLGLSIIDSAIKDIGGRHEVGRDETLGGAKFIIWIKTE